MNRSKFAWHKIRSPKPIGLRTSIVVSTCCLLVMACNSNFEVSSMMRQAVGGCNEAGPNLDENRQSTFNTYVSTGYSSHSAVAFSPEGKLTVAGADFIDGSNRVQWSVRQWDGTQWVQLMNYYLQVDNGAIPNDLVFDVQGNLYVAGEAEIDKLTGKRWVIRKFNGYSWSTTEVYESAPGYASSANALSLGPDGKTIYAVGAAEAPYENLWIVRKQ